MDREFQKAFSLTRTADGRLKSLTFVSLFPHKTTDPRHEPWEVRFEELQAFVVSFPRAENKSLVVPISCSEKNLTKRSA